MNDNPFLHEKKSNLVQIFIDELIDIRDGEGLKHLHNEDDTIERYRL